VVTRSVADVADDTAAVLDAVGERDSARFVGAFRQPGNAQ
jgi:hypothetical protein